MLLCVCLALSARCDTLPQAVLKAHHWPGSQQATLYPTTPSALAAPRRSWTTKTAATWQQMYDTLRTPHTRSTQMTPIPTSTLLLYSVLHHPWRLWMTLSTRYVCVPCVHSASTTSRPPHPQLWSRVAPLLSRAAAAAACAQGWYGGAGGGDGGGIGATLLEGPRGCGKTAVVNHLANVASSHAGTTAHVVGGGGRGCIT